MRSSTAAVRRRVPRVAAVERAISRGLHGMGSSGEFARGAVAGDAEEDDQRAKPQPARARTRRRAAARVRRMTLQSRAQSRRGRARCASPRLVGLRGESMSRLAAPAMARPLVGAAQRRRACIRRCIRHAAAITVSRSSLASRPSLRAHVYVYVVHRSSPPWASTRRPSPRSIWSLQIFEALIRRRVSNLHVSTSSSASSPSEVELATPPRSSPDARARAPPLRRWRRRDDEGCTPPSRTTPGCSTSPRTSGPSSVIRR